MKMITVKQNKSMIMLCIFSFLFFGCNGSLEKEFETKLKKNLEDEAFRMNCSLNIIELKVNKVKQSTMDSVYQNCYFGRLNQIDSYLKITEDYKTFVLSDKATNNWKTKFQNADPTKKGHLVWYYIKAIFINRNKEQTNILRQYSFSCFDDNNNLLITDIDFADWEFAKQ